MFKLPPALCPGHVVRVLPVALALAVAANAVHAERTEAAQALPAVPPPPRLESLPQLPRVPSVAGAASAAGRAASAPGAANVVVIEDDEVRIEETKVRGQTRRIVVQSKVGNVRPYEIIVGPGAKDSSQDRGATGASAWSLFSF